MKHAGGKMIKRVVITGMGTINPIGKNTQEFWENAKVGTPGITLISNHELSEKTGVHVAAELKDFTYTDLLSAKEGKRLDRVSQISLIAAHEAYNDAQLDNVVERDRIGVSVGSGIGGIDTIEQEIDKGRSKGYNRVSPFFIPKTIINLIPGQIAISLNLKGTCTATITACATGTDSIGKAYRDIKHGYQDVMLAGGTEASLTPMALSGFHNMKALATTNNPDRASIPFDKERAGFVMGEGAGILVLEELEHALARGAKIYGEILGYANTCDANHITAPDPEATGFVKALNLVTKEANVAPSEIDYFNAHGTSTPLNDKTETYGIKKFFQEHAKNISITSSKSMTGHLLGAAGAVESILTIMSIKEGFITPTINYQVPDEDCDLNITPNVGVAREFNYGINSSLGFGGHNTVLLFGKYK